MQTQGPQSYKEALQLLRGVQKSSRGAPLYSVVVNRPLGRLLAAGAYRLGMTPNQVTAVSAVATYSGIAILAALPPSVLTGVVVAAALVIGYALDSADGQLARLRGGGSLVGEWLDHVIDSGKVATLHVGVPISFYIAGVQPSWWLGVPLFFMVFYVVHFFGMLLTELLTRVHSAKTGSPTPAGSPSQVMSVLKLPTDYGVLCLCFVLLGFGPVFRWAYLLLAFAMAGYTILVLAKWYRQVARLG